MKRRFLLPLVIFALSFLPAVQVYGQCSFTGLNPNYCTNSPNSTLVPAQLGGTFSGPGVVGNTFNPALAGPGTHVINYNICQTTYTVAPGVFAPVSAVGNTVSPLSFTGALGQNADDGLSGALPIGFNFQFYCMTYTSFYICTNGYITFTGSQASPWQTLSFPTMNAAPVNVIAFPWTDLNLNFGGTITYTTLGSAPSRTLVVSFISVAHYNGNNGGFPVTLQLKLYESSNVIEMHTTTMPIPTSNDPAVMGIQDATGNQFSIVAGRNNTNTWSASNECYRWTPGASCASSQTTNVSPTSISVAGNTSLCVGSTATLTASGNTTYTWSSSSNSNSITVTPSATQTFSVSGTNAFGCVANGVITVTVDNTPTVGIVNSNGTGGTCPGRTLALNGTGATAYTWTGGPSPISNGVPFSISSTTSYTVTGVNACGTSTAATTVSIHPLPSVVPVASSASLCSGSSLTLTGTGTATNYAWSGGTGLISNGAGFLPALTSTYTVVGTSSLACTNSAAIVVTVVVTPQALPVAGPTLVCIGKSSTLTATGATNYTWTSGAQTVFTSSFVVTPAAPGVTTYTVTKANANCVDTRTISVITNSLPGIFAIVNPMQVCALQPATLSIGGGTSYTWTASGSPTFSFTGASPVVYPAVNTTYTAAASDGTCINTTAVSIVVDANPTITTSASSPSICVGQQVTLSASGGINYTWTAVSNTVYGASFTDSPTAPISYNVTGDNAAGCTASAQQIVMVHNNPTLSITSGKALACSNSAVLLTASGAQSYTWDASANSVLTSTAFVYPIALTSGLVSYTVSGSYTATGCQSSKTIAVSVFVPTLTVSGTTNTCKGGQIILTASGGNAGTYNWNTGSTTSSFPGLTTTLSSAAVFTVTANSTSITAVCPATQTVAVGLYPDPVITATAERSVICAKEATQLFAGGGVSYSWSNSLTGGTITVFPQSQTNNYVVTGTDPNGCVNTATVQVKLQSCVGIAEHIDEQETLLIYPNPNNGEFTLKGAAEMHLLLVNELGQAVGTIELSERNGFQAEMKGLPTGVYLLTAQDGPHTFSRKIVVTR